MKFIDLTGLFLRNQSQRNGQKLLFFFQVEDSQDYHKSVHLKLKFQSSILNK